MLRRLALALLISSFSSCLFFESSANNENNVSKKTDPVEDVGIFDVSILDVDEPCTDGEEDCMPDNCGNMEIDGSEECDIGADGLLFQTGIMACTDVDQTYQTGGRLLCNDDCTIDESECNYCGNGALNVPAGEECDVDDFPAEATCARQVPEFPLGEPTCLDSCTIDYSTCRREFTQVSVGEDKICAVRSDGMVTCWGGRTTTSGPSKTNNNFVEVSVGEGEITCGRKSNNDLQCWNRSGGQAGGGTSNVIAMSSGPSHACFIRTPNNQVQCVRLLDDTYNPTILPILTGSTKIASGSDFVCGLVSGAAICVQENFVSHTPAGSDFQDIIAGSNYFCGIRGDVGSQDLICPTTLAGLPTDVRVREADAGTQGICWITEIGVTECALITNATIPSEPLKNISVGNNQACGIVREGPAIGEIRCWGSGILNASPDPINLGLRQ